MALESTFAAIISLIKHRILKEGDYVSITIGMAFLLFNFFLMIYFPYKMITLKADLPKIDPYYNDMLEELNLN